MGSGKRRQGQDGKLIEAGRAWARGGRDPLKHRSKERAAKLADARSISLASEIIDQQMAAFDTETDRLRAEAVIDIWPEHWKALQLFLAADDCWKYIPGMEPVAEGLVWSEVRVVGEVTGIRLNKHRFWCIRQIVRGALEEFGRQRKERDAKAKNKGRERGGDEE